MPGGRPGPDSEFITDWRPGPLSLSFCDSVSGPGTADPDGDFIANLSNPATAGPTLWPDRPARGPLRRVSPSLGLCLTSESQVPSPSTGMTRDGSALCRVATVTRTPHAYKGAAGREKSSRMITSDLQAVPGSGLRDHDFAQPAAADPTFRIDSDNYFGSEGSS
jgi:hypothetical protein